VEKSPYSRSEKFKVNHLAAVVQTGKYVWTDVQTGKYKVFFLIVFLLRNGRLTP
jgi:hypothetical protein